MSALNHGEYLCCCVIMHRNILIISVIINLNVCQPVCVDGSIESKHHKIYKVFRMILIRDP